jgi:osmotically-inducible protein OsmY
VTTTTACTDEDLRRDVLEELKWDARMQPNEIGVAVKDGIVTLTGWVDSFTKKWVAERVAHRVRGVKAVVNDIEVRLPGSAERTDLDIAAAQQAVRRLTGVRPVTNLITVRPAVQPTPSAPRGRLPA